MKTKYLWTMLCMILVISLTLAACQTASEPEVAEPEAEAEVPKAMAEAFREGNLGVMDYYNMRNVVADTKMRESISGQESEKEEKK